jgi:proteic killer suppression protein
MLSMIRSFANTGTEDIFNGEDSTQARKTCPKTIWRIAVRKLDQLDSIERLNELRIPPGNRFESLSGDREGQFSIRINEKFRICFTWSEQGPCDVEIVDYH